MKTPSSNGVTLEVGVEIWKPRSNSNGIGMALCSLSFRGKADVDNLEEGAYVGFNKAVIPSHDQART